ncbi:transporter substrate-binding domain-containing protein [Clostridium sp. 'White wine YQ']|uniref:transporter substrate-binding domain-containing protein n=1 Tax=Clostridium sp. 'White wine YQ' TaxID=3027474 RepID=UPI00236628EC|nr:transporter substrate-binding domain-containing protein [Clostridium sp. 'White wine YQ']MDD7794678.1 transporter substrate-binding domain-containing protein [Clostridium sp. 'White wine YQ']
MIKKTLSILAAITIAASIFTGCGKKNDDTASKKYIISTDVTFAPFEFEQDGKYTGIDVDLLAAIAKDQGFDYELKPMDFNGIIPALTSNQIDAAIAGMSITDERKKSVDFSEPYFESGVSMAVGVDNNSIKSLDDLKGKTVAVKKGTAGAKFAEGLKDKYGLNIKYFDNSPNMYQEVANKNSDVLFEDYPVIAYKISLDKDKPTLKVVGDKQDLNSYGFAVNKGKNKELLDKFNAGLKKLKENGEYDKILAKYLK